MAIGNMNWGWLWVRDFDDPIGHTVTVQVRNRDIVADIGLVMTDYSGLAYISQIVSNSGVENFSHSNWYGSDLPPTLFRQNVTSVTFKLYTTHSQATARWMIYDWV